MISSIEYSNKKEGTAIKYKIKLGVKVHTISKLVS